MYPHQCWWNLEMEYAFNLPKLQLMKFRRYMEEKNVSFFFITEQHYNSKCNTCYFFAYPKLNVPNTI